MGMAIKYEEIKVKIGNENVVVMIYDAFCDNYCNLTEYLTQRPLERETIGDHPGNDGKPREHKGCGELTREKTRSV